jgi:CBS domain-containing protein
MTSPAVTTDPGRTISEAAHLMTERRVNRLPVIEEGNLVGIVTRADIVRVYVRSDSELTETVRHDVLLESLWLDPAKFGVEVRDGRVSISGQVGRRSTAEMTEKFIRMMPGVVDVDSEITWEIDDQDIKPPSTDPVFPHSPR